MITPFRKTIERAGWVSLALVTLVGCDAGSKSAGHPATNGGGAAGVPVMGTGLSPAGGAGPGAGGGGTMASAGTSGAPANGSGGASNGGDNPGTGAAPSGFGVDMGGYVTSGAWHGYAYTVAAGTGTTVDPTDFSMLAPGDALCVSGSVGPQADFSGVAMVGVNLNQDAAMGSPTLTVKPSLAGITVKLENRGTAPLRLQIQGPDGESNASDRWCAPVKAPGGFIPWSSFNTKCWDGTGTAYSGQPLVSASVLVPGGAMSPVAFDFCLDSLAESDAGSMPSGAGGAPATGAGGAGVGGNLGMAGAATGLDGSGTLTTTYDAEPVRHDGRNYMVQNNVWGAGATQSLSYAGTTFQITMQTGSNSTQGGPVSYPSIFIGSNYNRSTDGSNLPKLVSTIASVQTTWSQNAGSVSGTYNAAYDVWFSTNAAGDPQAPSGGYLMVWLYKPQGAQPIGGVIASGVTIPGASGSWDVWQGTNNGKPCISYVRTQATGSLTFDLNQFIKDATTGHSQPIKSSWYLTNVFAGFEIWSGGVGLKTTEFSAVVN